MFIKPEHIQGSPEWEAHRMKHLGASDAAAVMQMSPWTTPFQLWEQKVGLSSGPKMNGAMMRGTEMEPIARAAFEAQYGVEVFPQVKYHDTEKYMMASLDGLSLDGKTAVEIKCPGEATHKKALNGEVPAHYMPQLQQQLAVLSIPMIIYYSFDGNNGIGIEVYRDEEFISKLIKESRKFWKCVQDLTPPAYTNRDYKEKNSPRWVVISNRVEEIDRRKAELKAEIKALDEERDVLKDELVKDSEGFSCRCGPLTLGRSFPKGRVEYGSIPELKGVDLEKYRAKPKEQWTLRMKK